VRGDGDPLDICVLSERPITRNEIIVRARVVGGLQMVDSGDADDKIIAVLDNDYVYGAARDVAELPTVLVERLQHYFATYKLVPERPSSVSIERVYGRDHAAEVVRPCAITRGVSARKAPTAGRAARSPPLPTLTSVSRRPPLVAVMVTVPFLRPREPAVHGTFVGSASTMSPFGQ
jgi:hypothetical protein